ncbi:MAG TPA: U32 family peptidase, partial [Lachnospiraceae bacterium]|nr:U32 family peptidase [Lachnospiraceae bacterium]
ELDDGLFIPNGKLNDLRREAIYRLEEEITQSYSRSERERQFSSTFNGTEVAGEKNQAQNAPSIRVRLDDIRLLDTMLTYKVIEAIYLNCEEISFDQITTASSKVRSAGKRFYLVLPHVFRKGVMEQFKGDLMNRMFSSIDGIVIRNLEEYAFFKQYVIKYDLEVILDSNMYVINSEARAFWEEQGITRYTASVELNSQELNELNHKSADIIVYGHLTLMVSAQCVLNNTVGCIKNRKESIPSRNMYYELRDGKQKVFYVRNHCGFCYNTIYNGSPLYLFSHATDIKRLNPHSIRLDFTLEEVDEARKVMDTCIRSFSDQGYKQMESYQPSNMTKGHFNRGIE